MSVEPCPCSDCSPPDWSPARIAELTRLYTNDGLTFAKIGRRMGMSKNAIIGKVHRLGLERGPDFAPNAYQAGALRSAAMRYGPEPSTLASRLAALEMFPAPGNCLFPIGHLQRGGRFCGEPVEAEGEPYCWPHGHGPGGCWVRETKPREHAAEMMFVPRSARR
jgi:GcrA cell cycle regulator